jgi:regulatory protein
MDTVRTIENVQYRRRSRKCVAELDGGEKLYLDMDLVVEYGLAKGATIDAGQLDEIIGRQRTFDLKKAAYNYASYKPRTVFEVKQKLSEKGFDDDEIDLAIDFLREFDFLDDELYARRFVKNFITKKPSARPRIVAELRKRGIDLDLAKDIAAEEYPEEDKLDLAMSAAEKKMRAIGHKEPDKQKRSLIGYLQRLGFDWATIKEIENKYFYIYSEYGHK